MILRSWSARANPRGAAEYRSYFEGALLPELRRKDGFLGAHLLSGADSGDGVVPLSVHTYWASAEAIAAFAGGRPDEAVVEPEARAMLIEYDRHVAHREVLVAVGP